MRDAQNNSRKLSDVKLINKQNFMNIENDDFYCSQ